ncbi:MAG: hypothetical protein WBH47_23070 [Streptosporangiaceae bacterium]
MTGKVVVYRLFDGGAVQELGQETVQVSAHATHVTYRLPAATAAGE